MADIAGSFTTEAAAGDYTRNDDGRVFFDAGTTNFDGAFTDSNFHFVTDLIQQENSDTAITLSDGTIVFTAGQAGFSSSSSTWRQGGATSTTDSTGNTVTLTDMRLFCTNDAENGFGASAGALAAADLPVANWTNVEFVGLGSSSWFVNIEGHNPASTFAGLEFTQSVLNTLRHQPLTRATFDGTVRNNTGDLEYTLRTTWQAADTDLWTFYSDLTFNGTGTLPSGTANAYTAAATTPSHIQHINGPTTANTARVHFLVNLNMETADVFLAGRNNFGATQTVRFINTYSWNPAFADDISQDTIADARVIGVPTYWSAPSEAVDLSVAPTSAAAATDGGVPNEITTGIITDIAPVWIEVDEATINATDSGTSVDAVLDETGAFIITDAARSVQPKSYTHNYSAEVLTNVDRFTYSGGYTGTSTYDTTTTYFAPADSLILDGVTQAAVQAYDGSDATHNNLDAVYSRIKSEWYSDNANEEFVADFLDVSTPLTLDFQRSVTLSATAGDVVIATALVTIPVTVASGGLTATDDLSVITVSGTDEIALNQIPITDLTLNFADSLRGINTMTNVTLNNNGTETLTIQPDGTFENVTVNSGTDGNTVRMRADTTLDGCTLDAQTDLDLGETGVTVTNGTRLNRNLSADEATFTIEDSTVVGTSAFSAATAIADNTDFIGDVTVTGATAILRNGSTFGNLTLNGTGGTLANSQVDGQLTQTLAASLDSNNFNGPVVLTVTPTANEDNNYDGPTISVTEDTTFTRGRINGQLNTTADVNITLADVDVNQFAFSLGAGTGTLIPTGTTDVTALEAAVAASAGAWTLEVDYNVNIVGDAITTDGLLSVYVNNTLQTAGTVTLLNPAQAAVIDVVYTESGRTDFFTTHTVAGLIDVDITVQNALSAYPGIDDAAAAANFTIAAHTGVGAAATSNIAVTTSNTAEGIVNKALNEQVKGTTNYNNLIQETGEVDIIGSDGLSSVGFAQGDFVTFTSSNPVSLGYVRETSGDQTLLESTTTLNLDGGGTVDVGVTLLAPSAFDPSITQAQANALAIAIGADIDALGTTTTDAIEASQAQLEDAVDDANGV